MLPANTQTPSAVMILKGVRENAVTAPSARATIFEGGCLHSPANRSLRS